MIGIMHCTTWIVPAFTSCIDLTFSIIIHSANTSQIHDQLISTIWEFMHFMLVLTLFYIAELGDRLLLFENYARKKEYSFSKKVFDKLPNPLIVFDEETKPLIWNSGINALCGNQLASAIEIEAMLNTIKTLDNETTAMKLAIEQNKENVDEKCGQQKYKLEIGDQSKTFTIKTVKANMNRKRSLVLIFQDQTEYEARAKLEDKYQKMYVASIVHDIRTPLNGIMGIIDIIEELYTIPEAKEELKLAKNTCMQLLFLTYDITDYSQIEANKLKVNQNVMNINSVLYDCVQLLKYHFEKKNVKLLYSINSTVPPVAFTDKNRYMQILMNFLSNALKFTFKGEVNIAIDYQADEDLLITTVNDTGIGIREEDMSKLFKMFGKLGDAASTLNPNGVGFGLSICKKLSEAMGGYVSAKSEYGTGSSFTFAIKANTLKLPASETPNASISPAMPRRIAALNAIAGTPNDESKKISLTADQLSFSPCDCPKVLHVDDNACNKHVLRSYSLGLKVKADEADNGELAIEAVKKRAKMICCRSYKLILMDINMPVMNGIEATLAITKLAKDGAIEKVPVIAVTAGDLCKEDEEYYYNVVGFAGYLPKPLSQKSYHETLRKYNVVL